MQIDEMKYIIDLIFNFLFYVSKILTFRQCHSQHYRFGWNKIGTLLSCLEFKLNFNIKLNKKKFFCKNILKVFLTPFITRLNFRLFKFYYIFTLKDSYILYFRR